MKRLLFFLLLFASCTDRPDTTAPPVSHSPYTLELSVDTTSFSLHGGTAAQPLPTYGDTVLIRGVVSNDSSVAWTDTIQVGQLHWMGLTRGLRYMHFIPALAAGAKFMFVDTFVVPLDTLTLHDVAYTAMQRGPDRYWEQVQLNVSKPARFPITPVRYSFDVTIMLPETTVVSSLGQPIRAAIVYGRVPTAVQVKVSNLLDTPLPPLRFLVCLFDDDYCADWSAASSDMTTVPGKTDAYAEVHFAVDNDAASWLWYQNALTSVRICVNPTGRGLPDWFGPLTGCSTRYIFLKPKFETMCASVPLAPVGVAVVDNEADCNVYRGGSVYKFTANANERYRVTSNAQFAFIVPPSGAADWDERPSVLDIPATGTYYVVLQHSGPVTFTLTKER